MRALDLFAGAGGWDVAARELGIETTGVENMREAVMTRTANKLNTIWGDVWDVADDLTCDIREFDYDGLIASPPCQTFSMAGKGAGRKALDQILAYIDEGYYQQVDELTLVRDHVEDERTALVLIPLLFWHHMRPKWVAFEQVPAVLPVWEAMAEVMREAGYSVWTGNLHAEQYGVPQTRKRAILMAKRCDCTHNTNCVVHDSCVVQPPTPTHSRYYPRDKTRLDPGVLPWVSMAQALGWDAPATQDRQLGKGRLERHGRPVDRTTDDPSYAMRSQASGSAPGGGYVLSPGPVHANEGDETPLDWTEQSPSPSMVGSFRPDVVAKRGYRKAGDGPRQKTPGSVRVTVEEAAILQSFPPDFTWCGGKGKQYLQVGNACPPLLAKAILAALI